MQDDSAQNLNQGQSVRISESLLAQCCVRAAGFRLQLNECTSLHDYILFTDDRKMLLISLHSISAPFYWRQNKPVRKGWRQYLS